jgi:isopenicillin-N epimerase
MPPIDEPDLDFRVPAFHTALAGLPPSPRGDGAAGDEPFWAAVARLYDTSSACVNLENGYWGVMAEPVRHMVQYWTARINHENTLLVRQHWPRLADRLTRTVAHALGCEPDELVLSRGATEAMLALIGGYNRLQPGDTVLYCDLDYPAMRDAMQWLQQRRGVQPVALQIPPAPSREAVLATYAQALHRHPRTRLVLLTHLSHCTGLVMPVRELAALARGAGAEVIVDAAHSWGQLDFRFPDLGVPFAAFNLHKWVGAPLGCGCMVIRRGSLAAIDPYFGATDYPADDIRSRLRTGSPNFAAWLTLPAALQLHQRIGPAAKEARLRHLRQRWVQQARRLPGVEIMTPDDPSMVGGITSLRIRGRSAAAVVAALRDPHGVHTVAPTGTNGAELVRMTPAITTTEGDLDRLLQGLRAIVGAPA